MQYQSKSLPVIYLFIYFCGNSQMIPKQTEMQRTQIANELLNENKIGGLTIPALRFTQL